MNGPDRSNLDAARAALSDAEFEEAAHSAKRFLLGDPEDPAGLRVLFEALQGLGRSDDACVIGHRLVRACPTDFEARLGTARLELAAGRPSRVIELLAEHAGQDQAATAVLAQAYEQVGKEALAANLRDTMHGARWIGDGLPSGGFRRLYFARQLESLIHDHSPPTALRGELLNALDEARYPEAGELLQRWIQEAGNDVGRLALVDWCFLTGQMSRVKTLLDESSSMDELGGAWENRRGDLAQARGDNEEARGHYRKATILEPSDSNAWLDLARTEFLRGDLAAAREACRAVLDLEAPEEEEWLAREFLQDLSSDGTSPDLEKGFYGLVWWERGGGLLEVEVEKRAHESGLLLTGNVGRQLEDAGRVAFQFVSSQFGVYGEKGVHLHFPGFQSPKDGGSAGLLLAVLLYAHAQERRARQLVALTGEITLAGDVRAVGGIREKVTSAHLHGVDRVILPAANTSDLLRVPLAAKRSLEFQRVRSFGDVLSSLGW